MDRIELEKILSSSIHLTSVNIVNKLYDSVQKQGASSPVE
jgi:hypothetical protein